jgi:hypothetical protein
MVTCGENVNLACFAQRLEADYYCYSCCWRNVYLSFLPQVVHILPQNVLATRVAFICGRFLLIRSSNLPGDEFLLLLSEIRNFHGSKDRKWGWVIDSNSLQNRNYEKRFQLACKSQDFSSIEGNVLFP